MRARYSAYAGGLVRFVIESTDASGPSWRSNRPAWEGEIRRFGEHMDFQGLQVLGHGSEGEEGWVHFHADLRKDGQPAGFTERSLFRRRQGAWLYHSGEMQ